MKIIHPMMYVLLGATLTFTSCAKKDIEHIPLVGEIEVPDGFDWATTQGVALSMTAPAESNVSVYLDEQCSKLIAKLPVSPEETTYNLEVPTTSKAIYLQYTKGNGEKAVVKKALETSRGISRGNLDNPLYQTQVQYIFDDVIWAPSEMEAYRPAQDSYGTLMFEDTWPTKGDYDFNDFVVNYYIALTTSGQTSNITFKFKIRALGGKLPYRFCIQLKNTTKAEFKNYSFKNDSYLGRVEISEEGGDNDPVILVFTGWDEKRETNNYYNVELDNLNQDPYSSAWFDVASFTLTNNKGNYKDAFHEIMDMYAIDYFIQNPDNKMEIHKAGFAPTSLFKNYTEMSKSDLLDQDYYYYSKDNYVWVLQVPEEISWASEETNFLLVYPKFSDWLKAGGDKGGDATSSSWYNYPTKNTKLIIDHTKH